MTSHVEWPTLKRLLLEICALVRVADCNSEWASGEQSWLGRIGFDLG